ncbi:MAG: DUF3108 domain-containing protein [Gracilimonas sp.]|uniref:DUF3108 domain-containing protein n=1 Tax=Gracilimonas sp. TaxID=1974203 RepID=UPI001988FB51|nr:DUF3108 domain-containing protein [Gracilimonas sp.]MBD3616050.1 DUF3108 domain-containing protein [Gracilimonas sp.]
MKKFLLSILLFLLPAVVFAQHDFPSDKTHPPDMEDLFSVKETFRYEVKYGFLKLGWVEVKLLSDSLYQDQERKRLLTEITSNSSIPFMGKELDRFYSLFYVNEDGLPVESKYWKDNVDEGEYGEIQYWFERDVGKVFYLEEDDTRDTLDLEDPATSGHLIFYFSRLFAGTEEDFKLPVYVTKKKGYIYGKNSTKKEERNYEPFDGPIMAYKMKGSTENIEGPFGFSGDFRAWFLDDDLRVPLEARVKVLWGNVIVRMIEYTREEL